jgi:signal transduction histidine kinase
MPIRVRMALLGVAVIAATLLLFSALIYALARQSVPREQDAALRDRARQALTFLQSAPAGEFQPHRVPAALDLRTSAAVFVAVLGADGAPLTSTGEIDGAGPSLPPALLARADQGGTFATVEPAPGERIRVYVEPWSRPDLGLRGYAAAGQSLRHIQSQIGGLVFVMVLALVISLLVAAAAIWFVLGRALRPLKTVTHASDEIARTRDLGRRLPPVRTHDEVRRLTDSFNGMLARLEEVLESQRRFVSDASHELRTPLTTIRTNAAYLQRPDVPPEERDAALHDIVAESERMSRLVHDLLTLARADADGRLELSPVDLGATAREVCRRARTLYPDRQIETAGDDSVSVCGNEDALVRLLWILVDNAIKHTPSHGRLRIWCAARDSTVQLRVLDDGPGIPEADLERIFDRFYQADRARSDSGAGLGLAIARWIARAHGGTLRAYNNDWGGATFLFELPAAPPTAGPPSDFSPDSQDRHI